MDPVSFMYGFADELEKFAAKTAPKKKPGTLTRGYRAARSGASKAVGEAGKAGKKLFKAGLPYAVIGGVPLYFGAKAISEGFGRGVSEEADKRLPYER